MFFCVLISTTKNTGCFLAFETKDVNMEELNDSQAIGMCIYNVFILSAIGVALNFILNEQNEILYVATSSIVLVLIFFHVIDSLEIIMPLSHS